MFNYYAFMFYKGIKLVLFNWLQNYILLSIKAIIYSKNTPIGVDANKSRVRNQFPQTVYALFFFYEKKGVQEKIYRTEVVFEDKN